MLLQTENDEDEIVDLLGDDHTYSTNPAETLHLQDASSHSKNQHHSKVSSNQQRKPPITGGTTQKNKKSVSSG